MPFDMLMVLTTDYPDEPLLGLLLVELDPENWSIFQINKTVNKTLLKTTQEITASGYKCKANSNYIKTLDYLLNQRNSLVEVEPTSMGIGQHITILPRKTRQLPSHIIYIGTKKKFLRDYPQQASRLMRKPVFAHMVRGHWRKLHGKQTKGKDRSGKIIFNGYTWVIPHKRGEGEITDNPVYVVKGE